jgi:hypothetical protein
MARAGYCSACRNYVFLTPAGGCGNGHGPEYVSNPYEVPEAGAPVQPVYQPPQPAYVYAAAPPVTPPKKKRTGLVIALVIVALMMLCGCGVGVAMTLGAIPNPLAILASPEHQKVAAAGDFFKAIATADLVGLTRSIPSDAARAADPAFWTEKVLTSTDKSTFNGESWNGDVLAQTFTSTDGTKRTVTYRAAEGDKVTATMQEDGASTSDDAVFTMVKEVGGWKVLALGSGTDEFLRFTPDAIKKLQEDN